MKKESKQAPKSFLNKSILNALYDPKIPFNPAVKKSKEARAQQRQQKMKKSNRYDNDSDSSESSFLANLIAQSKNMHIYSDSESESTNSSVHDKIVYFESKSVKQSKKTIELTSYDTAKKNRDRFIYRYFNPVKAQDNLKISHFALMCTLGRGSFGRVLLAFHRSNEKFYAVKVLNKEKLVKNHQISHTINERNILYACEHPNIIRLYASFKDNSNIYFINDVYCNNDLYTLMKKYKFFDEAHAKFLSANIFLALEYLHVNDVIYRDLKPENILITDNGYLKVTDFGFAKKISNQTATMCGTPDYISPEVLSGMPYGKSVDWWAFGVFVYEMNNGKPPFYAANSSDTNTLYEIINEGTFSIPKKFGPELTDICYKLIEKNVKKRLGCLKRESNDIRDHPWFSDIDWMAVYRQTFPAPYIPKTKNPRDIAVRNSNKEEEPLFISKTDSFKNEFADF